MALISTEAHARSEFGQAATGWGIDVRANAVSLALRGHSPPPTPPALLAAVQSGQLLLFWPTQPTGWGELHGR